MMEILGFFIATYETQLKLFKVQAYLAVGAGDCILPAWAFAGSSFDLLG